MKFCGNCGNSLTTTQKFCTKCGSPNLAFGSGDTDLTSEKTLREKAESEKAALEKQLQERRIQEQLEQERLAKIQQAKWEQEQAQKLKELQDFNAQQEKLASEKRERELVEKAEQTRKEKEQLALQKQLQIQNIQEESDKQRLAKEKLLQEIKELEELNKRKEALAEKALLGKLPIQETIEETRPNNTKKYLLVFLILAILIGNGIFAYLYFTRDIKPETHSTALATVNIDTTIQNKIDTINIKATTTTEQPIKVTSPKPKIETTPKVEMTKPVAVPVTSPISLSDAQIKSNLIGKYFSICQVTANSVSEITIINKSLLSTSSATSKNYRVKVEINQGGDNDFIIQVDMYYLQNGQSLSFQKMNPIYCDVK